MFFFFFFFFFFFAMKPGQHELTHEPTQFNRAMRLKANRHGFSLNQRGLYAGVLRDPHDRQKKVCEGWCLDDQFMHGTFREGSIGFFFLSGHIVASETEEEIFSILGSCALSALYFDR